MSGKNKTKKHVKIDEKLFQVNKSFRDLKQKQRDKIIEWLYQEYKQCVIKNDRQPTIEDDINIVDTVYAKIEAANIWIPDYEIEAYYENKKNKMAQRLVNERKNLYKSYVDFYKSIIDQDRSEIVICNLNHEVIYMNPVAINLYRNRGGEKLIGQNIMDCHNYESQIKMKEVVDWFKASSEHNIVYTFHNEKENKDVYMIALRVDGELIGYYEKHEYRNIEKMKMYDLW